MDWERDISPLDWLLLESRDKALLTLGPRASSSKERKDESDRQLTLALAKSQSLCFSSPCALLMLSLHFIMPVVLGDQIHIHRGISPSSEPGETPVKQP